MSVIRDKARRNVGRSERVASTGAGLCLAAFGLRKRSLPGLLLALGGGYLAYRGVTGYCPGYARLRIGTGEPAPRSLDVRQATTIMAPRDEVFRLFHDFTAYPGFFPHLESTTIVGPGVTEWKLRRKRRTLTFRTEMAQELAGERLVWRTVPDGDVRHSGSLTFLAAPGNRGIEVHAALRIEALGPPPLFRITPVAREPVRLELREGLRKAKQLLEAGEVATTGPRRPARLGTPKRARTPIPHRRPGVEEARS